MKKTYFAPEVLGLDLLRPLSLLNANSYQDNEDGEITGTPSDFEN